MSKFFQDQINRDSGAFDCWFPHHHIRVSGDPVAVFQASITHRCRPFLACSRPRIQALALVSHVSGHVAA
jgi:hypothetical protein